jgi:glycolate oxidase FAD binding subunit
MVKVLKPKTAAAVQKAVADAVAAKTRLEIVGHRSRHRLGNTVEADAILDLSKLTGVVVYEPKELILTVMAATPLAEIEALLAENGQHLAFEPPDFGPLWGKPSGLGTISGVLSVGLGGPRRFQAGGARDHLLGFKAVNGFGEAFAAGGRVVKNVTGFDLPKLMAGAFGTLGVLTEVTLKVLPAPSERLTLVYRGRDEAAGLRLLRTVVASSAPVTGAALVASEALVRLEGLAEAVEAQSVYLAELVGPADEVLDEAQTRATWAAIGGGATLSGEGDEPVWRITTAPADAAATGQAMRNAGATAIAYDWAGGLVWAQGGDLSGLPGGSHALRVRGTVGPAFSAQTPGVAALSKRVRAQFDPLGLFNPGRMGTAA